MTTFHALGRGIIQQVDGRPPQLANWVEHPAGEAKAIEEIIVELASSDREFTRLWVDLLVVHPKADIPRETFDSEVDYQRYITERRTRGKATIGSLAGIYVKSLQEQSIANWLWLNSVAFEYERQVEVQDAEGAVRHIHPDFYYSATGTVHEHFALDETASHHSRTMSTTPKQSGGTIRSGRSISSRRDRPRPRTARFPRSCARN